MTPPTTLLDRVRLRLRSRRSLERSVAAAEQDRDSARALALGWRRERDAAQAHASHWRRDVGELVGLQSEGRTDGELLRRLQRILADGGRAQDVADSARAERDSAHDAIGRIAAAAGRPGAPTRWNVEDLIGWVEEAGDERSLLASRETLLRQAESFEAELIAVDEALAKAGATVERIPTGRYDAIAALAARDASDLATAVHALTERSYGRGEDGVPPMSRSEVLTELGDAPGAPEARGMVVDGDVLADVVADALPRWIADDHVQPIATTALDLAGARGMTVLHGPDLMPRALRPDLVEVRRREATDDALARRVCELGDELGEVRAVLRGTHHRDDDPRGVSYAVDIAIDTERERGQDLVERLARVLGWRPHRSSWPYAAPHLVREVAVRLGKPMPRWRPHPAAWPLGSRMARALACTCRGERGFGPSSIVDPRCPEHSPGRRFGRPAQPLALPPSTSASASSSRYGLDALDRLVGDGLAGQWVCDACDRPVGVLPCPEHQPRAYAEALAEVPF